MHPKTNIMKEENMDSMLSDDENTCSDSAVSVDMVSSDTRTQKKRKAEENTAQSGEKILKPKAKKAKKLPLSQCLPNNVSSSSGKNGETKGSKLFEVEGIDLELKPTSRNRVGKILIPSLPTKRILIIRQEKPRKKVSFWSSECFPSPDVWLPQEDAVLCALVHEYGSNWSLVSDALYGMTAGGFYRGRFRHPFHCCERFRELVQKFVLSVADNLNDKASNTGAGKALLRVSEVRFFTFRFLKQNVCSRGLRGLSRIMLFTTVFCSAIYLYLALPRFGVFHLVHFPVAFGHKGYRFFSASDCIILVYHELGLS